jgi:uncharacterized membrane protein
MIPTLIRPVLSSLLASVVVSGASVAFSVSVGFAVVVVVVVLELLHPARLKAKTEAMISATTFFMIYLPG